MRPKVDGLAAPVELLCDLILGDFAPNACAIPGICAPLRKAGKGTLEHELARFFHDGLQWPLTVCTKGLSTFERF
jgi:hypothetical protein